MENKNLKTIEMTSETEQMDILLKQAAEAFVLQEGEKLMREQEQTETIAFSSEFQGKMDALLLQGPKKKKHRFMKGALVAAAALTCLNMLTIAVAGVNLFEPVISLSGKLFVKSQPANPSLQRIKAESVKKEYKTLEDLEQDIQITLGKPQVLPKGYYLDKVQAVNEGNTDEYFAYYDKPGSDAFIYYFSYSPDAFELLMDQGGQEVELLELDGITYHFIQAEEWYNVVWYYNGVNYILEGIPNKADAEAFIKSLEYNAQIQEPAV